MLHIGFTLKKKPTTTLNILAKMSAHQVYTTFIILGAYQSTLVQIPLDWIHITVLAHTAPGLYFFKPPFWIVFYMRAGCNWERAIL